MYKPHRKPWPKSKTSDISKQSPSPLHHTFLLRRARFTAQPLSALVSRGCKRLVNLRFPNPVGRTACTSFLSSKTSLKMVIWFSFKVIFSLPTALGRHVWFCGYTCVIQPEVRYFRTCNGIFHGSFQGNEDAEYAASHSSKRHVWDYATSGGACV